VQHDEQDGVVLTSEQKQNRRARNIAIGVAVALLVGLFYVVTIVKLSGAVAHSAG
jgi:predicted secreted protein